MALNKNLKEITQHYHFLTVISHSSDGIVYRALDKLTGHYVAIKKEVYGLSQTSTWREINTLICLPPHPNIVELKEVFVDRGSRVFVVMEYVDSDLDVLIKGARASGNPFFLSEVNFVMKRILEGVAFIHSHGLMHRDLKPPNILVSADLSSVKICDFGLTRQSRSGSYTPGVVTYFYMAPELLHGSGNYSNAIDMWSVGCIMAELVLGHVAFPGKSVFEQVICIGWTRSSLLQEKVAPLLSDSGYDLLNRLLAENPNHRITAKDALQHAWFRECYGFV